MSQANDLLRTIEAIHAAGLDAEHWPKALAAATRLIGGVGATLEVLDKKTMRPTEFHGWGIPDVSELQYLHEYAPVSPRTPVGFRLGAGEIAYDGLVLSESAMDRDPFYADFLRRYGFRYFISVNLVQDATSGVPFAIQRSPKQGHVGRREIALMARLAPHMQQAFDVSRRLKAARAVSRTFEHALDWLADGMALIDINGAIVHANRAMEEIVRRADGIRLVKGRVEFVNAADRTRFAHALGQIARLRDGSPDSSGGDFAVLRENGAPSYVVSVRPLARGQDGIHASQAHAIVFVHDPAVKNPAIVRAMREAFGLTEAEAALATALQMGQTLMGYARAHRMSHNTVYWHLRRIKEKAECTRLPELIHKLNAFQGRIRAADPSVAPDDDTQR